MAFATIKLRAFIPLDIVFLGIVSNFSVVSNNPDNFISLPQQGQSGVFSGYICFFFNFKIWITLRWKFFISFLLFYLFFLPFFRFIFALSSFLAINLVKRVLLCTRCSSWAEIAPKSENLESFFLRCLYFVFYNLRHYF